MIVLKAIFLILAVTGIIWYFRKSVQTYFLNSFQLSKRILYLFDSFFILTLLLMILRRSKVFTISSGFVDLYFKMTYFLLGIIGLLVFIFIVLDLGKLFRRIMLKDQIRHVDESRRNFLKRKFVLGGIAFSGGATGIGFYSAYNPEVKKINISLPSKNKKLKGLKIAQISDLHIGPTLRKDFMEEVVSKVNKIGADIIVITGDLIDGHVDELKEEIASLEKLRAKLGVYYITGNHEYYWDANEWVSAIESFGISALINENKILSYNEELFTLAGVTDQWAERFISTHKSDSAKAIKDSPNEHYKILLAHRPKSCYEAAKYGYNLQLSGHTHGGQGFPFNIIVKFAQPFLKGLYKYKDMDLYVNSGTGFWGPPYRFLVRGEISEIILT